MGIMEHLFWIGHASFYLKTSHGNIFIDPFGIKSISDKADIVLITHAHFDHFSDADIKKVSSSNTLVIATKDCLKKKSYANSIASFPGFSKEINGIKIDAVPAYNILPERLNFHPKSNGWVGYVIDIDGEKLYHAGDTDFIDEMKGLAGIDTALLPAGGKYTMGADEAIAAANAIDAKHVVPMHYKHILGIEASYALEEKFAKNVAKATIMHEVQAPDYSPF